MGPQIIEEASLLLVQGVLALLGAGEVTHGETDVQSAKKLWIGREVIDITACQTKP